MKTKKKPKKWKQDSDSGQNAQYNRQALSKKLCELESGGGMTDGAALKGRGRMELFLGYARKTIAIFYGRSVTSLTTHKTSRPLLLQFIL